MSGNSNDNIFSKIKKFISLIPSKFMANTYIYPFRTLKTFAVHVFIDIAYPILNLPNLYDPLFPFMTAMTQVCTSTFGADSRSLYTTYVTIQSCYLHTSL